MENEENNLFDFANERILEEDQVTPNVSRWVTGIQTSTKEDDQKPDQVLRTMHDNEVKAGVSVTELPTPLDKLIHQLGDLYVRNADAKQTVVDSLQNPLIKDNKINMKVVGGIMKKLDFISKVSEDIGEDLDKLFLGK